MSLNTAVTLTVYILYLGRNRGDLGCIGQLAVLDGINNRDGRGKDNSGILEGQKSAYGKIFQDMSGPPWKPLTPG
jgi:hypothetical protein